MFQGLPLLLHGYGTGAELRWEAAASAPAPSPVPWWWGISPCLGGRGSDAERCRTCPIPRSVPLTQEKSGSRSLYGDSFLP